MKKFETQNVLFAVLVGAVAWIVPGAGHVIVGEYRRAAVIFLGIVLMFTLGLWIGSIGVLDPVNAALWYVAQMLAGPAAYVLGRMNMPVDGLVPYQSYGRPYEIGQIYTSIAGALNLLAVLSAAYMAYSGRVKPENAEE